MFFLKGRHRKGGVFSFIHYRHDAAAMPLLYSLKKLNPSHPQIFLCAKNNFGN